ncbi:MAG: 2'-5' RNA ligase family protein [Saprospiraceae bacterium]|nr:2'-5' RNA ligase family protein [Saprospiraceae bacterium]
MDNYIRRQITLFVDESDAGTIEKIRREYNPIQSELIRCHVTLCREDEILKLEQVISNIGRLAVTDVTIEFGKVSRVDNGQGLLLPATGDNEKFQDLRRQILSGIIENPGRHEPHITLMHPRNSTCTDSIFEQVKKVVLPVKLKFKKISFIEQENGGTWKTLQEFDLNK